MGHRGQRGGSRRMAFVDTGGNGTGSMPGCDVALRPPGSHGFVDFIGMM